MIKPQAKKKKATGQSAKPSLPKTVANRKSLKEKMRIQTRVVAPTVPEIPNESTVKTNLLRVMGDLRHEVSKSDESYRGAIRSWIARGCAVASFLEKNERHWERFCNSGIRKYRSRTPKPKKPDEALRFVFLWILGPGKLNEKRASKWYRAVGPLLKTGVLPAEIADAIEEAGGIEALAQKHAKHQEKVTSKGETTPPKRHSLSKEVDKGDAKHGEVANKNSTLLLEATLKGRGTRFKSLPASSIARLSVKIVAVGDTTRITILDAKLVTTPT